MSPCVAGQALLVLLFLGILLLHLRRPLPVVVALAVAIQITILVLLLIPFCSVLRIKVLVPVKTAASVAVVELIPNVAITILMVALLTLAVMAAQRSLRPTQFLTPKMFAAIPFSR
jgi:hypothetical protein